MAAVANTRWVSALAPLAAVLGLAMVSGAHAQRADQDDEEVSGADREARDTPAMRERVYEPLAEAQACAEEQDFECAREELERVREMSDKNSYETAVMWQFYAFIYFEEENTQGAMEAYENLLMQPELPLGLEQDSAYTLVQLYVQEERYDDALDMLDHWFEISPEAGPEPYYMRAQIYYQTGRYEEGIEPITTAIEIAEERGREIEEGWYQLLNVLYFETENFPRVIDTLRILLTNWPKKDYLVQLAGVYGQEGEEEYQTALFETAYEMGWLERGTEYTSMASMLLSSEVPRKAAEILQEGLDEGTVESTEQNWRMLATSWQQSQEDEQALPALNQAAEMSDDGELYHRLALSYANLARWEDCTEAARDALDIGLDRTDDAQLTLGNCLVELEQYGPAREAFQAAAQDERSRNTAEQWLDFIDEAESREQQLQQALNN